MATGWYCMSIMQNTGTLQIIEIHCPTTSPSGSVSQSDPHGNGMALFVKEGYKLVACAIPERGADSRCPFITQWAWALVSVQCRGPHLYLDLVRLCETQCYQQQLATHTIYRLMPPSICHAVATPVKCNECPSPAILFGFMFYSQYCIEAMLYTSNPVHILVARLEQCIAWWLCHQHCSNVDMAELLSSTQRTISWVKPICPSPYG